MIDFPLCIINKWDACGVVWRDTPPLDFRKEKENLIEYWAVLEKIQLF